MMLLNVCVKVRIVDGTKFINSSFYRIKFFFFLNIPNPHHIDIILG